MGGDWSVVKYQKGDSDCGSSNPRVEGFVKGCAETHKLLCASPQGSSAALEEHGHVALGPRLDLCLSAVPWPG